jgi:hypothetical protein
VAHKSWQEGACFTPEFIADYSWNGYEHDALFRNDGNGQNFTDIAYVSGIDLDTDGRGTAYFDYDGDGLMDVVVVGHRQKTVVLHNQYPVKNNWLHVDLVGTKSNRQGVGARLTVRTGTKRQIRDMRGGGGFLSSSSVPVAFGLGKAPIVDELTIRWPSGIIQSLKDVPVNRTIRVVETMSN